MNNKIKIIMVLFLLSIILMPVNACALTLDEIYSEIFPNGELHINAVEPIGSATETLFVKTINNIKTDKYKGLTITYNGFKEDDNSIGKIGLNQGTNQKEYSVKLKYITPDIKILKKVNKYIEKFPLTDTNEKDIFTISDMELINYLYAGGYNRENDRDISNSIINYSTELQSALSNTNITATLETRRGFDSQFSFGAGGDLMLNYNGIPYGYVDNGGIKALQVIYVPNSTQDDTDSYISAALKRIEEYIGKDKLTIKYAGEISDLNKDDWQVSIEEIIDINKTLGEYYTLKINGFELDFFIEKNSSKIKKNPILKTIDINTDSSITTSDASVPLDSSIKFNEFDKNSDEYNNQIKLLNLQDGVVFDISLYSNSKGKFIKKLDDGKFKVYIPIGDSYKNKTLIAYYINSDGTIEKHPVTFEGNYAVYETNHFSTYTLGEESFSSTTGIKSPNTGDAIYLYIFLSIISIMGILITINYNKSLN